MSLRAFQGASGFCQVLSGSKYIRLIFKLKQVKLQATATFIRVFMRAFLSAEKAGYRITVLLMAEEGQDSREMARGRRQCSTVLSITDLTPMLLDSHSSN